MFAGLKQKLGDSLANTAARSLHLVNQAKPENVRSPSTSEPNTSNYSTPSAVPVGDLVDVSLSSPPPQHHDGIAVTPVRPDSSSVIRSRTSSVSSQVSDVASSAVRPSRADDAMSETDNDEQSAIVASMTKEDLYRAFTKVQRRGQQYKLKYMQLAAAYKEVEEEQNKLKNALTQSQDKSLRRISELKEQIQLDYQAKQDLENNYQLMLDEKDEVIQVLRTQVNWLKEGKEIPVESTLKTEEIATVRSDALGAASPDEVTALREKVKRLESLLTKCKETIKANKDRTQQLVTDRDSIQQQLDASLQECHHLKSVQDETSAKYQSQLKEAKKLIEDLEVDKSLAVAAAKQEIHATLEKKDEELTSVREHVKNVDSEIEELKQSLHDGKVELRACHELIEQLKADKIRLEHESKKQIEEAEHKLEQVRAGELQELRRGKVEALQVLQKQMQEKIEALQVEREEALAENNKQWEHKWKQREAVKEAELQTKLSEHLAEMQLAVEEQQLQKTAALKLQGTAAGQLQQKYSDLLEQNKELSVKLENMQQVLDDRNQQHISQIEQLMAQHKLEVTDVTAKHTQEIEAITKERNEHCEKALLELNTEYAVQISELKRSHEEQLERTAKELETSYTDVIANLKSTHLESIEEYRFQVAQLQKEVSDAREEIASIQKSSKAHEDELVLRLTNATDTIARLEAQIVQFSEHENQLNAELEETKNDREQRIAAQNEAMSSLRTEINALTASEQQLKQQFEEVTHRYEQRLTQLTEEHALTMNQLSSMMQANQSEFADVLSELGSAHQQLVQTSTKLDERSLALDEAHQQIAATREELAIVAASEESLKNELNNMKTEHTVLLDKIATYERQIASDSKDSSGTEELLSRITELEKHLLSKDHAITDLQKRIGDFGEQIGRETADAQERSQLVERLLLDNESLLSEKEALARSQSETISQLESQVQNLESSIEQKNIELSEVETRFSKSLANAESQIQSLKSRLQDREEEFVRLGTSDDPDQRLVKLRDDFARERTDLETEIKFLRESVEAEKEHLVDFKENVKKQFEQRKQKVKLTIERLKAGFEETMREREETHLRNIQLLEEQKNKEKEDALRDLIEEVERLVKGRDDAVAEALDHQKEEVDYLKAELTSAKIRLRDALSQSQAEKEALRKHADSDRALLLGQIDHLQQTVQEMELKLQLQTEQLNSSEHGEELDRSGMEPSGVEQKEEVMQLTQNPDDVNLSESVVVHSMSCETGVIDVNLSESAVVHSMPCGVIDELKELVECKQQEIEQLMEKLTVLQAQSDTVIEQKEDALTQVRSLEAEIESLRGQCLTENNRVQLKEELIQKMSSEADAHCNTLSSELQQRNAEIETIQNEMITLREHLEQKISELNAQADQKLSLAKDEFEQVINAKSSELDLKCKDLEVTQQHCNHLTEQCSQLTRDLDTKIVEIANKELMIENLQKELSDSKDELNATLLECKHNLTRLEHEQLLHKEQIDSEAEKFKTNIQELENENSVIRQQLELATSDLKAKDERLNLSMTERQREYDEQIAQLMNSHETQIGVFREQLDAQVEVIQKKEDDLRATETSLKSFREKAKAKVGELQALIQSKEAALVSLREENRLLKETVDSQVKELEEKDGKVQSSDSALNVLKEKIDAELAELRVTVQSKELDIESSSKQIKLLTEEIDAKVKELEKKEDELRAAESSLASLTKQAEADRVECEMNQSEVRSLNEQLQLLREQTDVQLKDAQKKDEDAELAFSAFREKTNIEIAQLQSAMQAKEVEVESLNEQFKLLRRQVDDQLKELEKKDDEVRSADDGRKKAEADLSELQAVLHSKELEIASLVEQQIVLKDKLDDHLKKLDDVRSDEGAKINMIRENAALEANELRATVEAKGLEIASLNEQLKLLMEQRNEQLKDLGEKNNEVKNAESALKDFQEKTSTEIAELRAVIQTKESETESLHKEVAELKTLGEQQGMRSTELEEHRREMESEIDGLKKKLESSVKEVELLEHQVDELSRQKMDWERELKEMQDVTAAGGDVNKTKDAEIQSLKALLLDRCHGLGQLYKALVQVHSKHTGLQSTGVDIVDSVDETDAEYAAMTDGEMVSDKYNCLEMASQITDLGDENRRLQEKINILELELTTLKETVLTGDKIILEAPLSATESQESHAVLRSSGDGENETFTESVMAEPQYKAHVAQLNAIIEDLQQKLLDQDYELQSVRDELTQQQQAAADNSQQQQQQQSSSSELQRYTENQLHERVLELTRKLEESNWLHSLEIEQLRSQFTGEDSRLHPDGDADLLVNLHPSNSSNQEMINQYAMENRQLKKREQELLHELEVLKSSSTDLNSSGFNSSFFGPLLSEPTEIEYLRNIVFKYMLGTETKTLAKVICTVLKFSADQTRQVFEKEAKKEFS